MPQLGRPHKKRLTKQPTDMPDEEWAKILAGRKAMTTDRASRRGPEKERKNASTRDATVEAYLGSESKATVVPAQGTQGSSKVFDVDEPAASSAGRPDGVKRAKADKNGTSAASVEESFKMMIAEVTSNNSGRDQVNDARWRELLDKGKKKLKIEEAKAAAAQVAAQVSLLQAMHTQMFEQAKILTTDTSGMDEPTRKWFMEAQKRIVVGGVPA